MTKMRIRSSLVAAIAASLWLTPPHVVRAQNIISGANGAVPQNTGSTASGTNTVSGGNGSGTATTDGQAGSAAQRPSSNGANMNSSARQGQASQMLGAASNGLSGAMQAAMGYQLISNPKTKPMGYIMLAMAALSFAQAATTMGASRGSGDVARATDYNPGNYNFDPYTMPDGSTNGGDPLGQTIDQLSSDYNRLNVDKQLADLQAKGITVDPATGKVTTPMGTLDSASLSSPSAMSGLGLNPEQIQGIQDAIGNIGQKVSDKYKAIAMALDGGGGSGGSYTPAAFDAGAGMDMASLMGGWGKDGKGLSRGPASVAGMTRMAGGEPIGVPSDDIFQMIHRAYQAKRKANMFIETADPEPVAGGGRKGLKSPRR